MPLRNVQVRATLYRRVLIFAVLAFGATARADTFTVVNTDDSGLGSLRQAILNANGRVGFDSIEFNIPGGGVHTIGLVSTLPALTDPVVISGYTQPGAARNTQEIGDNAVLLIVIDLVGTNSQGFIVSASGSRIEGLIISGTTTAAIRINADNTIVAGNFIGVDATGNARPAITGSGVWVESGNGNRIGGPNPQDRNLIVGGPTIFSPSEGGVLLGSGNTGPNGTRIQGNYLGINRAASAPIVAQGSDRIDGITIVRATDTLIGGDDGADGSVDGVVFARNVISGNRFGINSFASDINRILIDNLRIQGNYIGVDATGAFAVFNQGDGVFQSGEALSNDNVLLGGGSAGAGNVISGNRGRGAIVTGLHVTVQGNFIGTDASGTRAVRNAFGLEVYSGSGNYQPNVDLLIGGSSPQTRNVISGNSNDGLALPGGAESGTAVVQGNYIGTQVDGRSPLPNGGNGISARRPVTIGDTLPDAGNAIAYNGLAGIVLRPGLTNNYSARITGNSIFGNRDLAIDFSNGTVIENDPGDADSGINGLQNFPVLTSVTSANGDLRIVGTLNSAPNATFRLEFFSNSVLDAPNRAQAENFIGDTSVTTDGSGNAAFDVNFPQLNDGRWITATATDPSGNTSQVARAIEVSGPAIVNATAITARNGARFFLQIATNGGSAAQSLQTFGLPAGLTADATTGIISGTPTQDGNYDVGLAIESGGTPIAFGVLTIHVVSDPNFPVIVSPSEATLTRGQQFTYKIEAPTANSSGDPVTYRLQGVLPPGLSFNPSTGTISGTLTSAAARRPGEPPSIDPLSGGIITNVQIFAGNGTGTGTRPLIFFLAPTGTVNISTRMAIGTGENVLIGGFIVTGNAPKKVILRAIGPSLAASGVAGALPDPNLELFDGTGALLGANDNWRSSQEQEIIDTTIPPSDDRESAAVATLAPGNYTAVVSGRNAGTGIGLVEIYDLGTASMDSSSKAQLAQISTRGRVLTGENVMIGGFIVTGGNAKLLLRGIGPSLSGSGIGDPLQDPTLSFVDSNGTQLAANDNWKDTQRAEIEATTVPPTNDAESAIVYTVAPGAYTAVVRGKNNSTGVGLVEVYTLQ